MFGLDSILGGLNLVGSIGGLLTGQRQMNEARVAREKALQDLGTSLDQEYQDLRGNNLLALRQSQGNLADANQQFGRNLGSNMAAAGVYNSSATAGAQAQFQNAASSQLANLGARNFASEQGILNENRQKLAQTKINFANQDYANSREDFGSSVNGLGSALASLSNFNLKRTAAPNSRATVNGGNGFGATDPSKAGLAPGGQNPFMGGLFGSGGASPLTSPGSGAGTVQTPYGGIFASNGGIYNSMQPQSQRRY